MNARVILFYVMLAVAAVMAISSSDAANVGQIVQFSGKITGLSLDQGTVTLESSDIYTVVSTSSMTIDGQRSKLSDLKMGMKLEGSAEIGPTEGNPPMPRKTIRMATASAAPTKAATKRSPMTSEEREARRQQISGTYWTAPFWNMATRQRDTCWVCLAEGGKAVSEKDGRVGSWTFGASTIDVIYFAGGFVQHGAIRLNAELTVGDSVLPPMAASHGMPATTEDVQWTRIGAPTEEMKAKVAAAPASRGPGMYSSVPSQPQIPSATPPPADSAKETATARAAEVIKANHNNLVFVTGKAGAGSGFIASLGGSNYLITNAHVAAGINDAGFKTLDGTVVKGGAAGVAVGHDIFCIALAPGGTPFEVMKEVDQNAGIGDDIVVLGNAEGSGVVNPMLGKIVGIGPNLVEVDAPFVPGNSGSPIVHLKSGKVIGVATYLITQKYNVVTHDKMPAPIIRRFGYRIDSVKTWQPVNWPSFYAQARTMEDIEAFTAALTDFFRDLFENKNKINPTRHTHPVLKTRIAQWLESKGRGHSAADRANADANFISFLKVASQSDLASAQRTLTYDYFQRNLTDEQGTRAEMAKAFGEIIQSIRE